MVSDKKELSKEHANLTSDQKKQLARERLNKEVKELSAQESKWVQEPTAFDHLPAHEKPFPIEPYPHERQRLPNKMSDEDRKRRAAWVHSQELTEREPVRVPELETMLYNPIRRLYRAPTDRLFNALTPLLGEHRVPLFRKVVPKLFLLYLGAVGLWYNVKYNKADWEEKKGFTFIKTRGFYLPGEERPALPEKWDYADNGFQSRKAFKGDHYAY